MHPLVQAQAQALIDTIHGDNQHCTPMAIDPRVARLGVVEGAANGKVYRVSEDLNIGGRRVDHLREGGFIGVVENHKGDRTAASSACRARRTTS